MALIKCPNCDQDISDKARKCPHCGFEQKNDFVVCKECGAKIDINEEKVCPNCGCPLPNIDVLQKNIASSSNKFVSKIKGFREDLRNNKKHLIIFIICVVVIIGGIIAACIMSSIATRLSHSIRGDWNTDYWIQNGKIINSSDLSLSSWREVECDAYFGEYDRTFYIEFVNDDKISGNWKVNCLGTITLLDSTTHKVIGKGEYSEYPNKITLNLDGYNITFCLEQEL